jgi:PAS domain S-box-containing protein
LNFEALFDASPNALTVIDRELRYVAANPAYLRATNRRLEDLLGRRIIDVFPHDPTDPNNESAVRLRESFERVLETGEPDVLALIPYRIRVGSGPDARDEEFVWSATHTPVMGDDGKVAFILQHTMNVTELQRVRREANVPAVQMEAAILDRAEVVEERNVALAGTLRQLRHIFDQAPVFMCYLRGPDLIVELANAAYHRLVGRRDIVGKPLAEVLPELEGQRYLGLLANVLRGGEAFVGRAMQVGLRRAPDAELEDLFVDFVYQPVLGDDGRTVGVFVLGSDVTAQKRAEDEIRQLAKVLDASRDFVGIADLESRPIFVNEAGLRLVGLADRAAADRTRVAEYFVERERERVRSEVLPAAIRDGYWEGELHFRSFQTGEEIPVLYTVFPLRDAAGAVAALATITRDLRAQKSAEREKALLLSNEQAARAQAEDANRVKDEFLAMVSHELRTPLTAMLGWLHLLHGGDLDPEQRARAWETIERNAKAQAQLIDDLLDVSRIMSQKLTLEPTPTSLATVISAAAETLRPSAVKKDIRLEVTVDASSVVVGDPYRLQQVVWNLLSNAVKFTPNGGRVSVSTRAEEDTYVIDVRDTGAGIAPEFLPHVFERFRQADGGTRRRLGGLGLGLSIVRYLVEAHGGQVDAFSDGLGLGSCFSVRLPRADKLPVMLRDSLPPLPDDDGDQVAPLALRGARVLIVEDEDDTREYVVALLRRSGAEVTGARSAAEAFAEVAKGTFDVLLLDIAMPNEDGYSLLGRIRSLPPARGGRTHAVALTAFARAEDRARALRAGFQNHVAKPVRPSELFAVLAAVVGATKQAS